MLTPAIFGLQGQTLNSSEKSFLRDCSPAGIILFARNIATPDQVAGLTDTVRSALGRDLLVLIDQEGGRVQRLRPPFWRTTPPMATFGRAFEKDPGLAKQALYLNTALIACDLTALGVNVDCMPLLDVPVSGSDDIIGDRAFSENQGVVAALGQVVCDALNDNGVYPVIKHIPGHGRATVDSHKKLPIVNTPAEELSVTDFAPFKALNTQLFAMTAHVVYTALDPKNPATLSPTVIENTIRKDIGFQGLLISDDTTMKALEGTQGEIAGRALEAGIDLILHCDGNLREMEAIAKVAQGRRTSQLKRIDLALLALEALELKPRSEYFSDYQDAFAQLEDL